MPLHPVCRLFELLHSLTDGSTNHSACQYHWMCIYTLIKDINELLHPVTLADCSALNEAILYMACHP